MIKDIRQGIYESRLMLGYAESVYQYLNKPVPERIYQISRELDSIESQIYHRQSKNLGFAIIPLVYAGMGLTAALSFVAAIFQKASAEKAKAECELRRLELIDQGKLPDDFKCGSTTDKWLDILGKVQTIVVILAGGAALMAILKLFKK